MNKTIKIIVVVILIFIVGIVLINLIREGKEEMEVNYTIIDKPYERISIIGEISNKGTFDPTVEYKDSSLGYLIYSGLEQPPEKIQYPNIEFIHTHLAKSIDNGKTWMFVKRLTESTSDTVESPFFARIFNLDSDTIEGEWHNEVPTLVYVPDDVGKEWKLFWHKYFSKDMPAGEARPRILSYSWIMMKEASTPEELDDAEEIKLFGTGFSLGARHNFETDSGRIVPSAKITTYTEPGSLYWNDKIYIALSYFEGTEHRLILISSSNYGKTWDYIGVLLDGDDAKSLDKDYVNFWGAALAEENGRLFLLVPPIHKKYSYQGTFVFEFEDIDKGQLKRENGKLIPHKYLKRSLPGNLNTGQADYHKHNTYGGMIMSQADISTSPKLGQIFNTKEKIVPDVETKCDEEFGLYTATLDGKNLQPLITNSWQQMTHARVSPDKKWVTFSRYTRIGKDGCATEAATNYKRKGEQYLGTEILIMRIDGTDLRVVVPARKFAAAVNSYWTPDGKGLVYIYGDGRKSRASHLIFDENMEIKSDTEIPTPEYLNPVVDPQWSGDWLVFPAVDKRNNTQGIWRMRLDGSMLEQLTARDPLLHDNDPKISPDGSKVAYSHKLNPDGTHYHFMMMDMQTKEESDFSRGSHSEPPLLWVDVMPEWSSDGKLLVFWNLSPDVKNKRPKSALHTIRPDGTGRKEIPLPEGYNYQSPVFFPGEGSGKDARIIFSTRKIGHSGKK